MQCFVEKDVLGFWKPCGIATVTDILHQEQLANPHTQALYLHLGSKKTSSYSITAHFVHHSPLPSARQHPSYGDCVEVKREYYQNSSVLDCVTQCSQSAAHLCEQFLQVQQIGFVTLGPLHMCRGGCLELYYCNMVKWFWWDSSLIFDDQLVSFQCFDTVGLVIWPVKIVPEMTYYVLSGTLNPTHSLT